MYLGAGRPSYLINATTYEELIILLLAGLQKEEISVGRVTADYSRLERW